ncbi:MAG: glutamate--tRNA ligase [Patescibacteria group bacterium]
MVRVRFAPSPTGELHIGGARTALYNYLFALKQGGDFIIRIEDTDQSRFVPGSLDRILQGLKWLGLSWQEGPDIGGSYGPYIQSDRLTIYKNQAQELIKQGQAYYCFCSPDRLNNLRLKQQAAKQPTGYDRTCLNLSSDQIEKKLKDNEPFTIRLKIPEGNTVFNDLIRGSITIDNKEIDDQVLLKSDGYPTYHLANVVDDHLMAISHVIRGEEWLPSTPKHLLLYKAFGWTPPQFAHLPNVLNKQKAKLSKRKDGETVWVQTYQAQGYLPEALANFLALLGWHPSDDRELYSLKDLTEIFSLDRVRTSGAIFDLDKLNWFNRHYLQQMTLEELDKKLQIFYEPLRQKNNNQRQDTKALSQIIRDRLDKLKDAESADWFFNNNLSDALPIVVSPKSSATIAKKSLNLAKQTLEKIDNWTTDDIREACQKIQADNNLSNLEFLWPARVAVTGLAKSPDFYTAAWALGKTETLTRLAWVEENMLS